MRIDQKQGAPVQDRAFAEKDCETEQADEGDDPARQCKQRGMSASYCRKADPLIETASSTISSALNTSVATSAWIPAPSRTPSMPRRRDADTEQAVEAGHHVAIAVLPRPSQPE